MKKRFQLRTGLKKRCQPPGNTFHSAAYKPGYFPILEFPQQGTGDNTRPVFIKTVFINNISQSDMQDRFSKVRSLWQ